MVAALPGATLARDGGVVAGSLKCSLGSNQITYRLSVRTEVADGERHRAVIVVTGKEARGSGTLTATLIVAGRTEGSRTRVDVSGDIEATGRGEGAEAAEWARVLGRLLGALLYNPVPVSDVTPVTAAAAAPRPALAVAPPAGDFMPAGPGRPGPPPQLIFGLVVAGLLLLLRRWRKHRRAEGWSG